MAIPSELLLLLLLPLLYILIGKGRKGPRPKLPPGPPRLPIIGNLHQLTEHPHQTLWQLSKKYGPLMQLRLGHVPAVVISSVQMAEKVLKTHDLLFCSRPALTSAKRLSYNFSDVALSPYTATWRELRKICIVKLLNPKMVESFRPVREEEVERMMSSISYLSSLSEPINLSSLLHSLSSNIIFRVASGKIPQSQERGDHIKHSFHKIFSESQALSVALFARDYFPWAAWVDTLTGLQARLEKNFIELDTFHEEVITAHEDHPTGPTRNEEDIVDVLLRLEKEDSLTKDHVKGLLMNIFIAGTDTTSATLEYAMAELMRNPNIMLEAQDEVRRVVGDKGKVEESDISQLSYLKFVVKETLRLHPVAPLLIHRETMGHVNINGYDILPKTRVVVNAWAIARDPEWWDEPYKFIPERFVDSTVDFRGHHFEFIPFGAGRRICPGLSFGIMTVELALANLLYAFNWELPDEIKEVGIDMDEATGITVHLKTSLQLKVTGHIPHTHGWRATRLSFPSLCSSSFGSPEERLEEGVRRSPNLHRGGLIGSAGAPVWRENSTASLTLLHVRVRGGGDAVRTLNARVRGCRNRFLYGKLTSVFCFSPFFFICCYR